MTNKNKTANASPAFVAETPGQTETAVQNMPAETAENVVTFEGKKGGRNAFAAFTARRSEAVENKVKLVSSARELLTSAAKLAATASDTDEKALEPAQKGGFLLYRGLADGVLSQDEVSDILGGTFGWKTKQNGEQSKTPAGLGEVIRKRVVRAHKAYDYAINGNEPVAFFEPMEREDVAPFVHELDEGKRSIWSVYDGLAELKAERSGQRPKAAFDPRRIAALTRDIGQNIAETVATVQRTPGLFAAYAGLLQMLTVIGNELPVPEEETVAA